MHCFTLNDTGSTVDCVDYPLLNVLSLKMWTRAWWSPLAYDMATGCMARCMTPKVGNREASEL